MHKLTTLCLSPFKLQNLPDQIASGSQGPGEPPTSADVLQTAPSLMRALHNSGTNYRHARPCLSAWLKQVHAWTPVHWLISETLSFEGGLERSHLFLQLP